MKKSVKFLICGFAIFAATLATSVSCANVEKPKEEQNNTPSGEKTDDKSNLKCATVYVVEPEHGTFKIKNATSDNKYEINTIVEFECTPEEGYELQDIQINTEHIGTSKIYVFPEEKEYYINITFKKIGEKEPEVDPEPVQYCEFELPQIEGGTIRIVNTSHEGKYELNKPILFEITLNEGYTLEELKVDDISILSSKVFTPTESKKYVVSAEISYKDPSTNVDYSYLMNNKKIKPTRGNSLSYDAYYEPCRGLKGRELKNALHDIIKGHNVGHTYKGLATIFQVIDADPDNSNNMIFAYEGSRAKSTNFSGSGSYESGNNREHTRAKSLGFPDDNNDAYKDMHHLRPINGWINTQRGSSPFGKVSKVSTNYGNSYSEFAGDLRGTTAKGVSVFEPKDEFKGDVARMIFYMATRYSDTDINLEVTGTGINATKFNNFSSEAKSTYTTTNPATHGEFEDLYDWATSGIDPVNDYEMNRNNTIDMKYQHNRNPFIDHPEFLIMIYDKTYSGPGALM